MWLYKQISLLFQSFWVEGGEMIALEYFFIDTF